MEVAFSILYVDELYVILTLAENTITNQKCKKSTTMTREKHLRIQGTKQWPQKGSNKGAFLHWRLIGLDEILPSWSKQSENKLGGVFWFILSMLASFRFLLPLNGIKSQHKSLYLHSISGFFQLSHFLSVSLAHFLTLSHALSLPQFSHTSVTSCQTFCCCPSRSTF